ncbi:MAG: ABC transporter ATP-binding protein [Bacteroidetes bacterium]|nr:MAG: ABC transporter ATP-binding protein [Bacteroidota bacterium]
MGPRLLEVKNLITEFRTEEETIRAVNGISFNLHKGETLGIVGESGTGKSVTSLSIMRLVKNPPGRISDGEIIYHSKKFGQVDLLKLSEDEIRLFRGNDIAMIFQEPMTSLNPVYACGDQVMEAILLHQKCTPKSAKQKTVELFKEVQLPRPEQMMDTFPHQLSGGQRQRVMIAMAISCNPSILIADEPTTALDVTVQDTILKLLQKLQRERGMSIVFITHDLGVIAELADRVIVMYKGKIVEEGSAWKIFANPQHPYTKGLLACRPPLSKRYHWLPTISDFMITREDGTLTQNPYTIEQITTKLIVSPKEREVRHKEIYSTGPLLSVRNLKTYFPIHTGLFGSSKHFNKAVDDVSFDVYPGETLGLVGESGCGKTTLGRTILRLIEPTGGEIIYKGTNIRNLSAGEMRPLRKNMQIIFQDPYSSLNPRITVGEALMEPMRVHKLHENDKFRKDKAIELLHKVNMAEEHFYRYPHEFSGGQRQRICIARALALNPEFIICDESVSALDVSIQAQVLNLLRHLQKEFKFTYIFISHDLSVVKFMSDRMIVMQGGKIVEMGEADSIYNNPQTGYTQKLISAIPKGELDGIKTRIETKENVAQ